MSAAPYHPDTVH